MNIESFGTTKILILGLPFGSHEEKWHLDVVPIEKHKIYYREGSGASSQRLWAVWSLCLKLSLISPSCHFHSICTNRLLFLVVQVNIILNSHLWVRLNPILEFQHALLPLKCCKLGNMPQFFSSFVISLWDPPLGLLRSLRACHEPSPP
jgi:hypothetical protein